MIHVVGCRKGREHKLPCDPVTAYRCRLAHFHGGPEPCDLLQVSSAKAREHGDHSQCKSPGCIGNASPAPSVTDLDRDAIFRDSAPVSHAGVLENEGVKHHVSRSKLQVDVPRVEELTRQLLLALGEDPSREGLRDTPKRVARWWREFIDYDPGSTETAFESVRADQMVTVRGMRVFSLCEHHMLPFTASITVGYISHDKVLGLSKFARISHLYAHRLQVQERLVEQIAQHLQRLLGHHDVAVVAEGDHTCMGCRGIRTPAVMRSSSLNGVFKTDPATRAEFFASSEGH